MLSAFNGVGVRSLSVGGNFHSVKRFTPSGCIFSNVHFLYSDHLPGLFFWRDYSFINRTKGVSLGSTLILDHAESILGPLSAKRHIHLQPTCGSVPHFLIEPWVGYPGSNLDAMPCNG